MKFTLSWVKDFLATDLTSSELEKGLFKLGLEVEDLSHPYKELAGLKVAQVKSVEKHPNASKLKVCKVAALDDQGQKVLLDIVCGAANVYEGMKGVLALVGQYLPEKGLVIKKAVIRGCGSSGMLCSFDELGLQEFADDQENQDNGIIEVASDVAIGTPYLDVLGLNKDEAVFEVAITPNRGDCFSIMNIARDLAAGGYGKFKAPKLTSPKVKKAKISKDYVLCPNFSYAYIKGVENRASPKWLANRLRSIGLSPKSALVDVTNYMCYTYGRPLHVFDKRAVSGNFEVRSAREGERLVALNDEEYVLREGDIVVADKEKALAIAGIIGGVASKTVGSTKEVFLESAFFSKRNIALTGQRLNIITDARIRFERGCDFALVLPILLQAANLIVEICGGEIVEFVSDEAKDTTNAITKAEIDFECVKVKEILGFAIAPKKIEAIFKDLGCEIAKSPKGSLKVVVPLWRSDITIYQDLIEELARIIGYDDIETKIEDSSENNFRHCQEKFALNAQRYHLKNQIRKRLASLGAQEVYSFSFAKKEDLLCFVNNVPSELNILNPINSDFSVLNMSVVNSLLYIAHNNINRSYQKGCLFEIVNVHNFKEGEYGQDLVSGILCYGEAKETTWFSKARDYDIFDIKDYALAVLDEIGLPASKIKVLNLQDQQGALTTRFKHYHPGQCGVIMLGSKVIGVFGKLHPSVVSHYKIERDVFAGELFLNAMPEFNHLVSGSKKKDFVPKLYPSVKRDISLVVEKDLPAQTIIDTIIKGLGKDKNLLKSINLFDIYIGEGVGEGKKSITVSLEFNSSSFTLQDKDINSIIDEMMAYASRGILATFR